MKFPFSKKLSVEDLQAQAEKDFMDALEKSQDKSRVAKQFCMRIALQSRTNIDKLFVEAAKKTERYDELAMAAIAAGSELPAQPEASCFQIVKGSGGSYYSYIPERFAKQIFAIGASYQTTRISRSDAIEQAQRVANTLFDELGVSQSFEVLQFLREEELDSGSSDSSDQEND